MFHRLARFRAMEAHARDGQHGRNSQDGAGRSGDCGDAEATALKSAAEFSIGAAARHCRLPPIDHPPPHIPVTTGTTLTEENAKNSPFHAAKNEDPSSRRHQANSPLGCVQCIRMLHLPRWNRANHRNRFLAVNRRERGATSCSVASPRLSRVPQEFDGIRGSSLRERPSGPRP